jgi:hypothetical protein
MLQAQHLLQLLLIPMAHSVPDQVCSRIQAIVEDPLAIRLNLFVAFIRDPRGVKTAIREELSAALRILLDSSSG